MHINTGLHTFTHTHTHTHTHRSINISEIFLKRLPIKTHRKFTALPTCASQGLQVPPKEEITREEVAWPLPLQANTHGLSAANLPHMPSLPYSSWFLWAPLLPPEFLLHSKSKPPDSAVSHHLLCLSSVADAPSLRGKWGARWDHCDLASGKIPKVWHTSAPTKGDSHWHTSSNYVKRYLFPSQTCSPKSPLYYINIERGRVPEGRRTAGGPHSHPPAGAGYPWLAWVGPSSSCRHSSLIYRNAAKPSGSSSEDNSP